MKNLAIYLAISIILVVAFVLVISGDIAFTLIGIAVYGVLCIIAKTKRGRKWWHTWYRMGMRFDRYLEGRISK